LIKAWLAGVSISRLEKSSLVLTVPTKFTGTWLSRHWADRIVASWLEIGGDKAVNGIRVELPIQKTQPQNKFDRDRESK
jgi:chromosomal replication initiation ATPase DnaA